MKPLWIALSVISLGCESTFSQTSALLPPTASIDSISQRELSIRWWQWAMSFPRTESPVADKTGARCMAGQQGSIWFLAGTYGTARTIRKCKVPAGRTLFFPLANYVVYAPTGSRRNCMALAAEAASLTDSPAALVLELNGQRIEVDQSHRQVSVGCFDLEARRTEPEGFGPAAANGYYVALKPLPKGTHALNFGAILPSIQQAVTYTLEVE